ncbi:hypothetical protein [Melittangium boletus]|uniref:Uncharacterized protein n=1 Tax=Melittangium boletus DSM 14713 TaxID=1294270 RepID=A0A250IEU3_9BACT|nr:hypothetical protein [Melittangium boletus]ATB29466.1 hypothetical protein MEBOL_002916 [Melittangium boletus DSM 14713]
MNSLLVRTLALCVGISAGWALAGPTKKDAPKPPPPPKITKAPETCKEQCDLLAQMCTEPCAKHNKMPQAKAACESNCDKMVIACDGSCREKGRIDAQYMKEHIKPPQMPKGAKAEED